MELVVTPKRSGRQLAALEQLGLVVADNPETALVITGPKFYFARSHDFHLMLSIDGPPRTKKNHGSHFGIRQSKAYVDYRARIVGALEAIVHALGSPLMPSVPYNVAATYYVDKRGELADKVGLDQGLYDALQDAGVVTNDWYFRQADGTRVVFGDENPRVHVLITPIRTENGTNGHISGTDNRWRNAILPRQRG